MSIRFVGKAKELAIACGLREPLSHQEWMEKMQELRKRLAKAKGAEEIQQISQEIRAVMSAPRI